MRKIRFSENFDKESNVISLKLSFYTWSPKILICLLSVKYFDGIIPVKLRTTIAYNKNTSGSDKSPVKT